MPAGGSGTLHRRSRAACIALVLGLLLQRPAAAALPQTQLACAAGPLRFPTSFWLVKTHKTGGSTLSGVLHGIANRTGVAVVRGLPPQATLPVLNASLAAARAAHPGDTPLAIASHLAYDDAKAALWAAQGERAPLLFTSVRHPLPRFYSVALQTQCNRVALRHGITEGRGFACDERPALLAEALAQDTLAFRHRHAAQQPADMMFRYIRGNASSPAEALQRYAFVFVRERMQEALVAFMLEFGLGLADIAHLPSKNRTAKYHGASSMPHSLNQAVLAKNTRDLQLWQLANRRLDDAVARLRQRCGGHVVDAALRAFGALQAVVSRECSDFKAFYAAHAIPAADFSYERDSGLGHRCVQHVARRWLAGRVGAGLS